MDGNCYHLGAINSNILLRTYKIWKRKGSRIFHPPRGLNIRWRYILSVVLALYDDVSDVSYGIVVYKQRISYFIFIYEIM